VAVVQIPGMSWSRGVVARGAGRPECAPRMIPVRLTSPLLARRQHLLNEMYNVMRRPA